MERILFTGISGLIGRYFFEDAPLERRALIYGTYRTAKSSPELFSSLAGHEACAFENRTRYQEIIREFRPTVIINAGAEGNVDQTEKNPQLARETNYGFPVFLAAEAAAVDARFIHFSSNAVYDGNTPPYSEMSMLNPLHRYGQIKRDTDLEIRQMKTPWVLLRPIVVYGWNFKFSRANPVSHFVPLLEQGKQLKMVDDQFENPVYAGDVARAIWQCIDRKFVGEINLGGGDDGVSRYDWLTSIADIFNYDPALIARAHLADFPSLVARPKDTRFNVDRLRQSLEFEPLTVREGALRMKSDPRAAEHLVGPSHSAGHGTRQGPPA